MRSRRDRWSSIPAKAAGQRTPGCWRIDMVLGRTADGLFWMFRYLERSENTA
ncbi:MAG: alpha-E domain-containing protein, partial [Boseongicola sp. SB0677_bin_26]|nr:alpha-E domain-containing protein [Boseongicola sp. SB0677_bin_26]